jgi:hypothetical protein
MLLASQSQKFRAFEQIFGANRQVPHVGGCDKEAETAVWRQPANPGSMKMQSHRDVNALFGLTLAMLFAIGLVLLVIAVRSYWLIA